MEISASPIHTQSLSRRPRWTTGINGSERQRPFHKSIHKTTAVAVGRETEQEEGESLGRQVSSESFILFLSFSLFYFNFYFNWNNIIPRSSHELRLTQRQHTSCANGVRLFGFELGLLVSGDCRWVSLPVSRSPQSPSLLSCSAPLIALRAS